MAGEREHDSASVTGGGRDSAVDIFVSYAPADRAWAAWIAWQLESAGYRVRARAWDFTAGANFVREMRQDAQVSVRTVAVLSAAYLSSAFAEAEWQAAWAADPSDRTRKLLLVRVEDVPRPVLLGQVVGVDLFGLDRDEATRRLLAAVGGGQERRAPQFPRRWAMPPVPARETHRMAKSEPLDDIFKPPRRSIFELLKRSRSIILVPTRAVMARGSSDDLTQAIDAIQATIDQLKIPGADQLKIPEAADTKKRRRFFADVARTALRALRPPRPLDRRELQAARDARWIMVESRLDHRLARAGPPPDEHRQPPSASQPEDLR